MDTSLNASLFAKNYGNETGILETRLPETFFLDDTVLEESRFTTEEDDFTKSVACDEDACRILPQTVAMFTSTPRFARPALSSTELSLRESTSAISPNKVNLKAKLAARRRSTILASSQNNSRDTFTGRPSFSKSTSTGRAQSITTDAGPSIAQETSSSHTPPFSPIATLKQPEPLLYKHSLPQSTSALPSFSQMQQRPKLIHRTSSVSSLGAIAESFLESVEHPTQESGLTLAFDKLKPSLSISAIPLRKSTSRSKLLDTISESQMKASTSKELMTESLQRSQESASTRRHSYRSQSENEVHQGFTKPSTVLNEGVYFNPPVDTEELSRISSTTSALLPALATQTPPGQQTDIVSGKERQSSVVSHSRRSSILVSTRTDDSVLPHIAHHFIQSHACNAMSVEEQMRTGLQAQETDTGTTDVNCAVDLTQNPIDPKRRRISRRISLKPSRALMSDQDGSEERLEQAEGQATIHNISQSGPSHDQPAKLLQHGHEQAASFVGSKRRSLSSQAALRQEPMSDEPDLPEPEPLSMIGEAYQQEEPTLNVTLALRNDASFDSSSLDRSTSKDDMFARKLRDLSSHKGLDLASDQARAPVHSITGFSLPPSRNLAPLPISAKRKSRVVSAPRVSQTSFFDATAQTEFSALRMPVNDMLALSVDQPQERSHAELPDKKPLTMPRAFNFSKRVRQPTREDDERPIKKARIAPSAVFVVPPISKKAVSAMLPPSVQSATNVPKEGTQLTMQALEEQDKSISVEAAPHSKILHFLNSLESSAEQFAPPIPKSTAARPIQVLADTEDSIPLLKDSAPEERVKALQPLSNNQAKIASALAVRKTTKTKPFNFTSRTRVPQAEPVFQEKLSTWQRADANTSQNSNKPVVHRPRPEFSKARLAPATETQRARDRVIKPVDHSMKPTQQPKRKLDTKEFNFATTKRARKE